MTLKELLQDKQLTAVELINFYSNQIINVYVNETNYGLKTNTSDTPCGVPLEYRTDFILTGDTLSVSDISVDINDLEML